jgi:two-component system, NarL family, sensor histidine kinase UhpB
MKSPAFGQRARTDFAIVCAVTGSFSWASVRFDLSESVFQWTHAREWLQLDELPQITAVLAVVLLWFAWRRMLELRSELVRRSEAEARLADALFENRRLGQKAVEVQESERRNLARELHDELGQYIVAIRLDAASIRGAGRPDQRSADDAAASIARHVDHVQLAVKRIIGRLRPSGLDELGLAAALESCVETWRERMPQTHIALSMDGALDGVGEDASLVLFRLTQESLTNVSRHARARRVEIQLNDEMSESGSRTIRFRASDDGIGADLSGPRLGFGLPGMRERVLALGGRFDLHSSPGEGFEVRATLVLAPCPREGLAG